MVLALLLLLRCRWLREAAEAAEVGRGRRGEDDEEAGDLAAAVVDVVGRSRVVPGLPPVKQQGLECKLDMYEMTS